MHDKIRAKTLNLVTLGKRAMRKGMKGYHRYNDMPS